MNLSLAALTIVLSWSFIQTIFAFHYAHEFYGDRGSHKTGLSFPECKQPEYWDFLLRLHQTADVSGRPTCR